MLTSWISNQLYYFANVLIRVQCVCRAVSIGRTRSYVVTSDIKTIFRKGATDTEPKAGDRVTVIARRDPTVDQFTATAIIDFGSKKS